MPIAPYTLDDAFDESQIPNEEILKSVSGNMYENIAGRHAAADRPPASPAKPYTRKRPFDAEDNSEIHLYQRPKKKARIEARRLEDWRLSGPSEKILGKNIGKSRDQLINTDSALHPNPLPLALKVLTEKGKGLGAVKAFQRHVAKRKALVPPRTPKRPHSETLAAHTIFWNDLLAKRYPRDGATALDLSVSDLLKSPDTKAAIFDVNETYLGRRFVNLKSR